MTQAATEAAHAAEEERPPTRAEARAANRVAHRQKQTQREEQRRRRGADPRIEQTLADLFEGIRGKIGVVYRVSRLHPVPIEYQGTPVWVADVPHTDDIDDLEGYVRGIGHASGWMPGKYRVEALVQGEHGKARFAFEKGWDFPSTPLARHAAAAPTLKAQLAEVGEVVGSVRAITGESSTPGALAATLVDTLAKGMALGKGPNALEVLSPVLTPLMGVVADVLKRFAAPPATPPVDPTDQALRLLERLGLARRHDSEGGGDILAKVSQYLDAGARIAEAYSVRTGRVPVAEGPSVGVEIARILPQLAPMVGQAFATLGRYLEVREIEARAKLTAPAAPLPRRGLPTPAVRAAPPPASPLAPFHRAIVEGEFSVFPALRDAIEAAGGAPLLQALHAGSLLPEAMIAQYQGQLPELALSGAPEFVARFVAWLKSGVFPPRSAMPTNHTGGGDASIPPGHYLAVCQVCGDEGVIPHEQPVESVRCIAPRDEADPATGLCGGAMVRAEGPAA